jgi:pre-mRNA-splicing factor SYF2
MAEHQRSKVNRREDVKKERAREEAEKLIAKRDAEEAGEDYERSQFWNYSAESVEKWNEKQEAKRIRMDNKFTGMLQPRVLLHQPKNDFIIKV